MLEQMEQSGLAGKSEKIDDPRKWLEEQEIDGRKIFTFTDPSPDETKIDGLDIRKHYKDAVEPHVPEDDRWKLEALVQYVTAPIITENFSSDSDSNKWQKKEAYPRPEVNRLFESNRIKGNTIAGVFGTVEELKTDGWLNAALAARYAELLERYAPSPPARPPGEFERFVRNVPGHGAGPPGELEQHEPGPLDGPPGKYDEMTLDEKKSFTKELASFAMDLYKAIAKRYTPETSSDRYSVHSG